MRPNRTRVLAGASLTLALLAATPALAGSAPQPGASGIGDAYFPLDGNGGIDVESYDIRDRYRFGSGKLTGTTRLQLRATQDLSTFNLDLLLPVENVWIDGDEVRWKKPKDQQGHELRITPDQPLASGEEVTVKVRYAGRPGDYSYAGEKNWLADGQEVVAMNQPHMAPWWFPSNDHPQDKALVDLRITVPRSKEVVANGHRVSRTVKGGLATTRWRADEPMAPYLAFFAAGDFQVASGQRDGLPWYVAVSEALPDGQQREAMDLMKQHDEVVEVLEEDLGDYPFSTTGGITTALDPGFALENQTRPTYPFLGSWGLPTVVHEVAHQWFGDSVAVEQWRDIWLNEGPATFYEYRYLELTGEPDAAQDWLRGTYEAIAANSAFWDRSVADPGAGNIFSSPVYNRGGMTLQALRNRIGEADFWTLMQTWVTDRAGGNGSTEDFHALAEEVSGEDLDGFFEAWVRAKEKPADTAANGLG